jgi:hypothetical protein
MTASARRSRAATDWIVPNGSASGDFDVRATLIAGSLSGTGEDPGVWLDLGSDREFQVVRVTVGISACSFRLDIRDDTGSTVASATYSASAEIV